MPFDVSLKPVCVPTVDCFPMSISPLMKNPQRSNGSGLSALAPPPLCSAVLACGSQRQCVERRKCLTVDNHPQRLRHRIARGESQLIEALRMLLTWIDGVVTAMTACGELTCCAGGAGAATGVTVSVATKSWAGNS